MKLKLISLLLLIFSLQSFAMEQSNKDDGQKKNSFSNSLQKLMSWNNNKSKTIATTKQINREESLGTIAVLPDELLVQVILILSYIDFADYIETGKILKNLNPLKLTSKYFNDLVNNTLESQNEVIKSLIRFKKSIDIANDFYAEFYAELRNQ